MKCEVYQDRRGGWRWRLRARNGNIVADSGESYTRAHGATRAFRATVLGVARSCEVVRVKR